jgi:hypothetical protein
MVLVMVIAMGYRQGFGDALGDHWQDLAFHRLPDGIFVYRL